MDQQVSNQLQAFLKEIDTRAVGIISIDGLVDSVLRHSALLKQISFSKKESASFDMSTLTMVFTEIVKQIYSSLSCYDISEDNRVDLSLPWVNIAHSLSMSLNSAINSGSNAQHVVNARKRIRYHRQGSRVRKSVTRGLPEVDSPSSAIATALRQQLSLFASSLDVSNEQSRGLRSLCAVSRLLELLVACALDGPESRSIPGFGFASLSSLFAVTADLTEAVLQSSTVNFIVLYPLLITMAICLISLPSHDASSDLRLTTLRWLSLLDEFLKSSASKHSQLVVDFFLTTISFLTFSNLASSSTLTNPNAPHHYALQNVSKMLVLMRSFISSKNSPQISGDVCASLLRFISFFILSLRLQRMKGASSAAGSVVRSSTHSAVVTASGAHCCTHQSDACCIRSAVELAIDIAKGVKLAKQAPDSPNISSEPAAVDLLLAELVRSGACCCCFNKGSEILSLLKKTSHIQRHQSSLLAVNVCIRVFLDYYPRPDGAVHGQNQSCPFHFAKDSNKNDVLAEYVSLPLSIFTSKVNINQTQPSSDVEESCFQVARQILTLTSTSAFSHSSQAKHFLFRHLVGPLFDWVLEACFTQTDLFISRKALPIVLRILEDFLGDKDLSYFADFASTTRLTFLSRLFEAGNGFCYITSLIRILVRCPSHGSLLSAETLSQLDVVKKVAVSTFLPAFYSATKRLTNALYATDEDTNITITCNDIQIFSHCFFMLDESPYFASTFVNLQSTECFVNLLAAFEHYVSRRRPTSYSKEFVQLFVFVMASLFRLKSTGANGSVSFANIRFFPSHHEFYLLLRLSFDYFCALLTPRAPAVEHWCIIRDCRASNNSNTDEEAPDDDTFTSSVGELQQLIGQSDAANLSDGGSTADTDYEADEDEDNEYSIAKGSEDEEEDAAYRENTFGNAANTPTGSSFAYFVGPRFYLALELVQILCRFIRHSRNCIDPNCPTRLAELTCSLESVLAMITQTRVDSFSNTSIESMFDLIFSGDLHPFLLNTEHNWHTIQHQLFCLLSNLGARHVTPRHLCAIFRMTTSESVSLVSAATSCLSKLAAMSDYRAPPFCLRVAPSSTSSSSIMRTSLPGKWQPGKCCLTICSWIYLEGAINALEPDAESAVESADPPAVSLCTIGSEEFYVSVFLLRRSKQVYETYAEISLNGRLVRRKLHLPFVRHRWHMLAIQLRDEMIMNKDQYSVSVTVVLDCEQVSTASAAWPVEEVPRKELETKTVAYFSAPTLVIGGFNCDVQAGTPKKQKSFPKLVSAASTDGYLLAGAMVFSTWLEAVELIQVFARLPGWMSQPISSLFAWPAYPSMCVTPCIIDDNPRAFLQQFKGPPDFFLTLSLILRPTLNRDDWTQNDLAAEFIRVSVQEVQPLQEQSGAAAETKETKESQPLEALEVKVKTVTSISSPSTSILNRIECASFHNSVLQVGGPDFLVTWLSSLCSITDTTTCRHLLLAGVETLLISVRHPHIYFRFVEMQGFEMLYQLLMLKILPNANNFLDDNLVTILINASLSRPILTTSSDCMDTVFTSPSSFSQLRIKNRFENCRDAGVLVQVPEIWSSVLLNGEFLSASSRLSCWRLVFSTVSLLVSSSGKGLSSSQAALSSDSTAVVSSTATFNRTVFSRMEFPCRCYTILRAYGYTSSVNEQAISDIVLTSLGDFLLSMNDPSAVDIVADFLVALHPLSAFFVDVSPTDLFPTFLFSHPYNYRARPTSSRFSQSSGGGSFSLTNNTAISFDVTSPTDQRRNSSAPVLTPVNTDKPLERRMIQGLATLVDTENAAARLLSSSDPSEKPRLSSKPEMSVDDSSVVLKSSLSSRRRAKRGAGVMVRLVEVLDAILRRHPHVAYTRLFKCIRPETFLFFLGGGSDDLMPSVDFSCRLLHTIWQSLTAAECRIASDLFLKNHGPILISFQITRALGIDVEPMSSVSIAENYNESYQNMLFASLSAYYYDFLCRNVATLEQVTEWSATVLRQEGASRTYGCRCSSLTAAVKASCPAKVILNQWWSIPAVEMAINSLFSFKSTSESRSLLRLVATEFFLLYTYIRPQFVGANIMPADSDGVNRLWSLVSTKLQLMWLLITSSMSSVGDGGVEEAAANAGQRLNFEADVENTLICCLTFVLAILSSNSFSSTSEISTSELHGLPITSPAMFLSLTNTMSSVFPELGIANYWLISTLKQFEHVCELATSSANGPDALPLVRKSAQGPSAMDSHHTHTRSSVSTAVSFTVSDDEEDEDESDDIVDSSHNVTPILERSLSSIMQKQHGMIPRFVELIAAHIRRWPNAQGSGDLAKALLLFVCRQVEAGGVSRGVAADAGCLMAACAAAVSAKTIDMLFITEIIHAWMASGTTALSAPSRQWRNVQAGAFVANSLHAYEVEKGSTLLPTQRIRLKEVISKLPSMGRVSSAVVSSGVASRESGSFSGEPDAGTTIKLRRCCDSLLPLAERISEMNHSGREQHHSKRKNLTLPNSLEPPMKIRLQLIEVVRRFAHPAAPMGDSSMVSTLYPDEWELDPVEATLGVYSKLRRQALSLPSGKVVKEYHRQPSLPHNLDQNTHECRRSKRSVTVPNTPGSPGGVVTRSTFLGCDCNDSADNPASIVRDWTYLIRTFGTQLASAMNGFLMAIVQVLSTPSSSPKQARGINVTRIDLSCQCTLVTPSACVDGEMFVTEDRVIFLSQSATVEDIYRQFLFDLHSGIPFLVTFSLQNVVTVYPRRYLLKENSLEVFLTSGKTYFFAFNPESVEILDAGVVRKKSSKPMPLTLAQEVCERVRTVLLAKCRIGTSTLPSPTDLQVKWLKGQLTNFEYLTMLNRIGGRSHNEMMQYPVFPWVLCDYTSTTIDLASASCYRDMSKQISLQPHAPSGKEKVTMRYNQLLSEGTAAYHFPSLYSNSGIVAHYLVRIPPFTQACLLFQDGNFDIPDRTFSSFAATWSIADVKELLPEFFYLPEFLTNFCHLNLGVCQSGLRVWDVALPPWAGNNPRRFVMVHRQALESTYVRLNLCKWIDLIFGFRQIGKGAIDASNVFHPATYFSSAMTTDLQSLLADPVLFAARQAQIRTYGQVPRQLFEFAHPSGDKTLLKKTKTNENLSQLADESSPGKSDMFGDDLSLSGISVGNYAGSHAKLICVWQTEFQMDFSADRVADVFFADSASIVVLASPVKRNRSLLTIVAPQKQRRRTILSSSTPNGVVVSGLNYFSVDTVRSFAGGFTISTTKRLQTWSTGASSDYQGSESVIPRFHPTAHHEVTCGPVHSPGRNTLFFGTSVGLILAYYYEAEEFDLSSDRPEERLPLLNTTPVQVLCAHETAAAVTALAVSDDFKMFVAGTADGRCVIFDLNTLSFVRQVVLSVNGTTLSSPVRKLTISPTLGDVAVYCESGYLAMFTVNGALVGQTAAPKNVVSLEFSSCPEGTSVNSLLVVSADPSLLSFYCSWDLRLVRKIRLDDIAMADQSVSGATSQRSKKAPAHRTKPLESPVMACYSHPDSQLIAVLTKSGLVVYSNSIPSQLATAAIKNIKVTLIS